MLSLDRVAVADQTRVVVMPYLSGERLPKEKHNKRLNSSSKLFELDT
jgi:hypothetical protein